MPDEKQATLEAVRVVAAALFCDVLRWSGYLLAIAATFGAVFLAIRWSFASASHRQDLRLRRFAESRHTLAPGSLVAAADIRMRLGWIPASSAPVGALAELEGQFVTRQVHTGEAIEAHAVAPRPAIEPGARGVTSVEVKPGQAEHIRPGMRVALASKEGEWPGKAEREAGHAFEVLSVLQDASSKTRPTAVLVLRVPDCEGIDFEAMTEHPLTPIVLPPPATTPRPKGESP